MSIICLKCGSLVTTWRSTTVHDIELETETVHWLCRCGETGSRTMITIEVKDLL